jgi:hypothetical protein
LSPPLGIWRRHTTRGHEPARFLHVRNNFFNIAMGNETERVHTPVPNRYPELIEPDYSGYDPSA